MRSRTPLLAAAVLAVAATTALIALRGAAIRELAPAQGPHVDDGAGVLGPVGGMLEQIAQSWDAELGIDVHVVTLRGGDEDLGALALRVFEEREVGRSSPVGGLLCLLDATHRRARIEVSPSLVAAFPEPFRVRLAEQQLAPYGASAAASMAISDLLRHLKDYALARELTGALALPDPVRGRAAFRSALARLSSSSGVDATLDSEALVADLKAVVPKARRARYAPAAEPAESAERFLLVLSDLAGDPTLPLFTEGSQLQRSRYPVAPFEYWRQHKLAVDSRPWRLIQRGDRAVVTSRKPALGFVPILLARSRGLWRVDLVETWKNLFIDSRGGYVVVNRDNPYVFGLSGLRQSGRYELAPLELRAQRLGDAVAELESQLEVRDEPALHFRLAELLFRNGFAAVDALVHYEKAARGAPNTVEYVQAMGERAMYLGLFDYAMPFLEAIGPPGHERLGDAHFALGQYRVAEHYYRRALRYEPRSKRLERRIKSVRRLRLEPA